MNKNGERDFKGWMKVKEMLQVRGRKPDIKEGELWWSSIGENIGTEICGKGKNCTRPVLVFKKLNKSSFWAIPLTSRPHEGSWYVPFEFNDKNQVAVLSQIEHMSVSRLHRKMGQLPSYDFDRIYDAFMKLANRE